LLSRKVASLVVFVIVVFAFQAGLGVIYAFSGDQISDPLASIPVTIDGKFTTSNEWSDALRVTLSDSCNGCSGAGYLYLKHTVSTFYFLEDFISVTSLNPSGDFASVTIDSAHDGGSVAGPDDVRFDSSYPTGGSMAIGVNKSDFNWGNALPAGVEIAMSFSTSPNFAFPHIIAEFAIPFSIFPKLQSTIGFAAAAYACASSCSAGIYAQLVIWPSNYYVATPSTWGELTISSTSVPVTSGTSSVGLSETDDKRATL
jgi:hypothetical protein